MRGEDQHGFMHRLEQACNSLFQEGRKRFVVIGKQVVAGGIREACMHMHADGGVQITGSHNPADYNGFKVVCGKTTIFGEEIQKIYQMIVSGDLATSPGSVKQGDIIDAYVDNVASFFDWKRRVKVVVDAGNGTAGPAMTKLLKKLIPDNQQLIYVPFLSMLIMLPLTAFAQSPVGTWTSAIARAPSTSSTT